MKHPRVTLQDIAQLAGVTKMTVSRFLRTPEKVAADTAER
ncbi:LacI family DNA-binding transcriptional regulator, partial [Klebsiella aerogenes]